MLVEPVEVYLVRKDDESKFELDKDIVTDAGRVKIPESWWYSVTVSKNLK